MVTPSGWHPVRPVGREVFRMLDKRVFEKMSLRTIPTRASVMLVRFYQQAISPYLGRSCRHDPSCSAYAIEAFERYGVFKGVYLTVFRLMRCHPWGSWGYDPVP